MILSDLQLALSNTRFVTKFESQDLFDRLLGICNLFLELYGDGPVKMLRAPARINILGEHIDYVSYLPTSSLTFGSRERDALMLYRKMRGPQVRSASTSSNYAPSSFQIIGSPLRLGENIEDDWLSFLQMRGTPAPHWQNYIEGAVSFARAKFAGRVVDGFDFVVDSTIPAGGGASSSSALVVLGGAAIRETNGIQFTLEELAKDSALAEWFVGTRGGSMDHTTICLARASSAVLINYSSKQTKRMMLPGTPFEWITFFSKPAIKGHDVMIEYNERAAVSRLLIPAMIDRWKTAHVNLYRRWQDANQALAAGSLTAVNDVKDLLRHLPETIAATTIREEYPDTFCELERSFPALLADLNRWPLKLRDRALHHLGEVNRVALATRTLASLENAPNNADEYSAMHSIGTLLNESHESLKNLYDVSTDEVEHLMKIVRSDTNVLGARLMGGGFGGNVLALTTREHSGSLIDRVQKEYYHPQDRDGVREGSIMVSTPGDGLAHLTLESVWRDTINQINSLGPNAAEFASNLQALVDVLPGELADEEVWPVIVAAGKGTRATSSGLTVPKPVALVGKKASIQIVLENVRKGLKKTRTPLIIVSPDTENFVREVLEDHDVMFVLQPEPLGTADAVLHAYHQLAGFEGRALVVWSTQPVIRPNTFQRIAKLTKLFNEYAMVVPTTFRDRPYAPLNRNERGEVRSASETHLEGAQVSDFGETNIGMFLLESRTMFEVLFDLRERYWNESLHRYDRPHGELGFPNELINYLGQRDTGVFACPIADPREEQGIKKLEDIGRCERFILELEEGS